LRFRLTRRKTSLFVFLAAALLLSLTGCGRKSDWVMFRGEQGRGGTTNVLKPPLGIKWKLNIQESLEPAYAFNNPVVIKDTIYFGSTDGNIYALDIRSGYMRWVYKTKGSINSVPYGDENNIYIGSNDGFLYAISRKDGTKSWAFEADSTIQSTITRTDESVLFVSDGGHVFAVSPEGQEQYRLPNPVWYYFSFQVYDNVLYFAPGPVEQPHSMGAYDLSLKDYLFILDTQFMDAIWYSFPALKGDKLFFSTADYLVDYWRFDYYCYDRRSGKLNWKYTDFSEWGLEGYYDLEQLFNQNMLLLDYLAPSLWKNLNIYTSGDSVVRAMDSSTGKVAWRKKFDSYTTSAPTVAGNYVYFGISENLDPYDPRGPRLVCLSAKNGKKMWEMEVEGNILSAPVIARDWMIFGTDRNMFYVLEALF